MAGKSVLLVSPALLLAALACGGEATAEVVATAMPAAPDAGNATEPTATSPPESPATPETPLSPPMPAIGDTVEIGDFALTVNGFSLYTSDDQFFQPDEGNRYVTVDLTLTNQGSETANVSGFLQMTLKDGDFRSYAMDTFSAGLVGASPDGEIAPDETVRGKILYQVPQDATGFVFVFDASVWGSGKAFIDLGDPA